MFYYNNNLELTCSVNGKANSTRIPQKKCLSVPRPRTVPVCARPTLCSLLSWLNKKKRGKDARSPFHNLRMGNAALHRALSQKHTCLLGCDCAAQGAGCLGDDIEQSKNGLAEAPRR